MPNNAQTTTQLHSSHMLGASLVAQTVKNLPAVQETQVPSLDGEDALEEEMAAHSRMGCLENPMDRGAWRATVYGVTESDMTE